MTPSKPIAETPHFIVLDHYTRIASTTPPPTGYQTEAALENELIADLQKQGYEYLPSGAAEEPEATVASAQPGRFYGRGMATLLR